MDLFLRLCTKDENTQETYEYAKVNGENNSAIVVCINGDYMSEEIMTAVDMAEQMDVLYIETGRHYHEVSADEFYNFLQKYKKREKEQLEMFPECYQCLID